MNTFLPNRIEGVRSPRNADPKTLRMCVTEQDAILASIVLSGLTYREIAARMGVSKSLVHAIAQGERPLARKRIAAFCNATGTNLYRQHAELEVALRLAQGRERKRDRIAAIVAPTEQAWAVAA